MLKKMYMFTYIANFLKNLAKAIIAGVAALASL